MTDQPPTPIRTAFSNLVAALIEAAQGSTVKLAIIAATVVAVVLVWKLV